MTTLLITLFYQQITGKAHTQCIRMGDVNSRKNMFHS